MSHLHSTTEHALFAAEDTDNSFMLYVARGVDDIYTLIIYLRDTVHRHLFGK